MNDPRLVMLASALADRYVLDAHLGAGGMATVFRAQDLRHERHVAIKVLHPDLGAMLGGERFLAEIRTTARLQHPHILPLLDSGEAGGLLYYVMPMVSGETLRARLDRERPLPIGETLKLAQEIGSALDYAHRQGVVHRDIKPDNILLHEGQALVADFGIALAVQGANGGRITQTGMSLGTPQYMSPEQAMGERALDGRADVYALGAMLYECLCGDPPFTGTTVHAIVSRVLTEKPTPLHVLRDTIPSGVNQAVMTALAKLPADRFQTVGAFVEALTAGASTSPQSAVRGAMSESSPAGGEATDTAATRRVGGTGRRVALGLALLGNVGLAAALAWWIWRPLPPPPLTRQQVVLWRHSLQDPLSPGATIVGRQVTIAPDGRTIVYTDSGPDGWSLWRKTQDALPQPIPGTKGAISPFFSPDGQWVGYVTTDLKVRKVPVGGGGALTLAEDAASDYTVATWLDNGSIVYPAGFRRMHLIPQAGGAPRVLKVPARLKGYFLSMSPLPESRGFLFSACGGNCAISSDIWVYDFAADSARLLVPRALAAWYSATGHLLYKTRDGSLLAAPFDAKALALTGAGVPILDGMASTGLALSATGTLVYALDPAAQRNAELRWVSRDGASTAVDSTWRAPFDYPALSPDGGSIAVSVAGRTTDLWIRRRDGVRSRLTLPGAINWRPSWRADGSGLAYIAIQDPTKNPDDAVVRWIGATPGASDSLLFRYGASVWEAELSRNGQWLVFRTDEPQGSVIRARRLLGDTTVVGVAVDSARNLQPALSPDGAWIAYNSTETGMAEVYVAAFPGLEGRQQVSMGGGLEPRWSNSGKELFFVSGDQLMTVPIMRLTGPSTGIEVGEPAPLFSLRGYRRARNRAQFDVAPDDQRFLMIRDPDPPALPTVILVEHWFQELLAKVHP